MHFSNGFWVREYALWFVNHEVIFFFEQYRNLYIWCLIQYHRGEISTYIIDIYLVIEFQLIRFFYYFIIYFDSSSCDNMVKKTSRIGKLFAQSRIYSSCLSQGYLSWFFVYCHILGYLWVNIKILYNFFLKKQGYFPFLHIKAYAKICKNCRKEYT